MGRVSVLIQFNFFCENHEGIYKETKPVKYYDFGENER